MRILGVAGFAWEPKGTVRARAFPLMTTLAERGHEVKIITVPYDNLTLAHTHTKMDGVEVVGLPLASMPMRLLMAPRLAVREVVSWKPDVVHIFKPKGYAGSIAKKLLRETNFPVCLDVDDWEGWGGWNDVKSYPFVIKEYIDRMERSLMRRTHSVTAASRVLEGRVKDQRTRSDDLYYVPNCITRKHYERLGEFGTQRSQAKQALRLKAESKTILYAGHFEAGDDVAQMCRVVLAALLRGCTLLLVGDGPEMPSVKRFFSKNTVDVRYIGRLPMEGYFEAVTAADLAVFPYPKIAVYQSKCSARILDYLAMGRAVITTDFGQNPEYITNGTTGVLVSPNDEAAFSGAILRLLDDDRSRKKMGVKARSDIGRRFIWEDNVVTCEAAYSAALMKARNGL